MKRTCLLALLLACFLGLKGAIADDVADLKAIVSEIDSVESRREGAATSAAVLARNVVRRTTMIDQRRMNASGMTVAYYYRALARSLQNAARLRKNEPIDVASARAALADFDRVVRAGVDIPGWKVSAADAAYAAGQIALHQLKSPPTAYAYWDRCARREHAGCMNVMAEVKFTGSDGQKIDVAESLSLHEKVYLTGTRYGCAGALSAHKIALITHFTGNKKSGDEEITWINRAHALLDEVAAKRGANEAIQCGRATLDIDEYLLRRGRGERPTALLERAGGRAPSEPIRLITEYLLRVIDDDTLRSIVGPQVPDDVRCQIFFWALWNSSIAGRSEMARTYMRSLLEIGNSCGTYLRYARKFGL
jgi:hypothetical protein